MGLSVENQQLYQPIVYKPFFSLLIDSKQRTLGSTVRYQRRMGAHDVLVGLNLARTTVAGGNERVADLGRQQRQGFPRVRRVAAIRHQCAAAVRVHHGRVRHRHAQLREPGQEDQGPCESSVCRGVPHGREL